MASAGLCAGVAGDGARRPGRARRARVRLVHGARSAGHLLRRFGSTLSLRQKHLICSVSEASASSDIERVARFAKGHPLTLVLAAAAMKEQPAIDFEAIAAHRVIEELTRFLP